MKRKSMLPILSTRHLFGLGVILSLYQVGCTASQPSGEGEPRLVAPAEASWMNAATASTEDAGEALNAAPPKRDADLVAPYPKGRWRLADPSELQHVVLWMSQILIRHREVTPSIISFKGRAWPAAPAAPNRSRSQALALAQSVAEQATANPASFANLVAEYSEDTASKPLDGSLGAIVAGHLIGSPQLLDALAAMRPGDTSQVVESIYGFHVLRRDSPPPEETVSGTHIVIGYEQASWLRNSAARGDVPPRSRNEALALAQQLYERARQSPATFHRLVDQHSEHVDALRGGDMGSWSTREAAPFPREIEVLRRLAVGAVAPPLDTHLGIQVIKREPNRARGYHAMSSIKLEFQTEVPERHPSSPEAVLSQAKLLSDILLQNPERFAELQTKQGNASSTEQWIDGRGLPSVEATLQRLLPGQIAPEPLRADSFNAYLIVQRLDPSSLEPPPAPHTRHELPAPIEPDVSYLISEEISRPAAHQVLLELGDRAAALADSPSEGLVQRDRFVQLARRLADRNLLSTDISSAFALLIDQTKGSLGDSRFDELRRWMNGRVEAVMLDTVVK